MRVAVIGAGPMGRRHAEKLAGLEGCELVAVVDPDRARAEALAGGVGCAALLDYRGLFGLAEAAVVAVPTPLHREVAGACLEAGLHVLIEKPMTRTLAEAEELNRLARERNLVLQVGHVERYNPAFRALQARTGRPLFIQAERLSSFQNRGLEIDVVLDLMIHDLDLCLALVRDEVATVTACGFRVLTSEVDIANAQIEFAGGCIATLSASRVSQAPVRRFRVFQRDEYFSADLRERRLRKVTQRAGVLNEAEEPQSGRDALVAQAKAFIGAIRGEAGGVDGESGATALQLALEVGRLVREREGRVQ